MSILDNLAKNECGIIKSMKDHKNLIIFVTLVFAFASIMIIGQNVFAAYTWSEPTEQFPGGNAYPPIDTSSNKQDKAGTLWLNGLGVGSSAFTPESGNIVLNSVSPSLGNVKFTGTGRPSISLQNGQWIGAGSNTLMLSSAVSGETKLYSSGKFTVDSLGLVLPNKTINLIEKNTDPKPGMITYDSGKIWYYDNVGWKEVGSGSGGTDGGYWSEYTDNPGTIREEKGIYYDGNKGGNIKIISPASDINGPDLYLIDGNTGGKLDLFVDVQSGGNAYIKTTGANQKLILGAGAQGSGKDDAITINPNGDIWFGKASDVRNPQLKIADIGDNAQIQSYNGSLLINSEGNDVKIGLNNIVEVRNDGTVCIGNNPPTCKKDWSSSGGSGNGWTLDGTKVYTMNTVGIGTNDPNVALDINGDISVRTIPNNTSYSIILGGGGGTDSRSSWTRCSQEGVVCKNDNTPGGDNVGFYSCSASDVSPTAGWTDTAKEFLQKDGAFVETGYYQYSTLTCVKEAGGAYKIKNAFGTLNFESTQGLKFSIGQDGVVTIPSLGGDDGKYVGVDKNGTLVRRDGGGGGGSATYAGLGSSSNGNMGGYSGANGMCPSGAHMCSEDEILKLTNSGSAPSVEGWVKGGVFGMVGTIGADCEGFSKDDNGAWGRMWVGSVFQLRSCQESKPVICCK